MSDGDNQRAAVCATPLLIVLQELGGYHCRQKSRWTASIWVSLATMAAQGQSRDPLDVEYGLVP